MEVDMRDRKVFVERRAQGDYVIRKPASLRASSVAPTQGAAIVRLRQKFPDVTVLVERVR
jgi:hypothetical protein